MLSSEGHVLETDPQLGDEMWVVLDHARGVEINWSEDSAKLEVIKYVLDQWGGFPDLVLPDYLNYILYECAALRRDEWFTQEDDSLTLDPTERSLGPGVLVGPLSTIERFNSWSLGL